MQVELTLREPHSCTRRELDDFVRLVRRGFDGSDEGLRDRVGKAECLWVLRGSG